MDEVDKIIIHSLRQIGCSIDEDAFSMASFTPDMLVRSVSLLLLQIKPQAPLPQSLPVNNMAQRFTVTTQLAEMCTACGYRSDIGYQTFLYPNAVDVRRLFMFLIEQLPKGAAPTPAQRNLGPIGEYEVLRREIKDKMLQQLRCPWVPQFCRVVGNRRAEGCSSQNVKFAPQLNLNIPCSGSSGKAESPNLLLQVPSVFQQTASEKYDLISSVLHKNALDLHSSGDESIENMKYALRSGAASTKTADATNDTAATSSSTRTATDETAVSTAATLTPLEKLNESLHTLKTQNDALLAERTATSARLNALKSEQAATQADMEQLRKAAKQHERTCVVLENPKENLGKLRGLIETAQERRRTLTQQWQTYREPMAAELQSQQALKQSKNVHGIAEMRATIGQLERALREKSTSHAELGAELKNATAAAAPRKEYTRRILEFIGNIRKQRADIFKVLDDTRDLQKQLNSVSAQLQRQFNYTDDLLYQSAKHDLHAKRAYKLLASLHTTCNQLVELVLQTGSVTKEIRELEVQIDRERLRNVAESLQQISADIRSFEEVIRGLEAKIRTVENEVTTVG